MKEEERFFIECYQGAESAADLTPADIINKPGFSIPFDEVQSFLESWVRKGWYEGGFTLERGWFTNEAKKQYDQLMNYHAPKCEKCGEGTELLEVINCGEQGFKNICGKCKINP